MIIDSKLDRYIKATFNRNVPAALGISQTTPSHHSASTGNHRIYAQRVAEGLVHVQ